MVLRLCSEVESLLYADRFHDAYVAAPSQKAALAIIRSDADLLRPDIAEIATDEAPFLFRAKNRYAVVEYNWRWQATEGFPSRISNMCHVLIIEDEPLVAMMIEDALLDSGATTVAIASTEAEAVEAAAVRLPAFISSDVNLLEGTGPNAVRTILETRDTYALHNSHPGRLR